MHTPLLAPAAPSIAAGIRTPAAARALLAVLLAPLFALMDQAVARIFVRLEDLLAQFQAGTLPVPAAQSPARDSPAVKTGAREARSGAAILLRYQNK